MIFFSNNKIGIRTRLEVLSAFPRIAFNCFNTASPSLFFVSKPRAIVSCARLIAFGCGSPSKRRKFALSRSIVSMRASTASIESSSFSHMFCRAWLLSTRSFRTSLSRLERFESSIGIVIAGLTYGNCQLAWETRLFASNLRPYLFHHPSQTRSPIAHVAMLDQQVQLKWGWIRFAPDIVCFVVEDLLS